LAAPLIPQEIYLLERYSSLEYFGRLRDAFADGVKAAEDALAEFMKHLPPDYRSRPLWQQPDAVWGERVIPNMQWALEGLNNGYIHISHGNLDALGMAGNVNTTLAAIGRDYSCDWMSQPFRDEFARQWQDAPELASNIAFTADGDWTAGALTTRYTESSRGPLDAPPAWPQYRLNSAVRVKTGNKVPQNGIYLPDDDGGCAQLLIAGYDAWQILLPRDPNGPAVQKRSDRSRDTTWTLVVRVADSGGGTPGATDPIAAGMRLRCEAKHPCPREGYWFTPAKVGSRRWFKQGEVMPDFKSDYGMTIWQWDDDQRA
jgi:hypothetical protein